MTPIQKQRFDFLISQLRDNPQAEIMPIMRDLGFEPYSRNQNLMAFENDDGETILVSDKAGTGMPVSIGEADISFYEAGSDTPVASSRNM